MKKLSMMSWLGDWINIKGHFKKKYMALNWPFFIFQKSENKHERVSHLWSQFEVFRSNCFVCRLPNAWTHTCKNA